VTVRAPARRFFKDLIADPGLPPNQSRSHLCLVVDLGGYFKTTWDGSAASWVTGGLQNGQGSLLRLVVGLVAAVTSLLILVSMGRATVQRSPLRGIKSCIAVPLHASTYRLTDFRDSG
jgi:hypothetical protein